MTDLIEKVATLFRNVAANGGEFVGDKYFETVGCRNAALTAIKAVLDDLIESFDGPVPPLAPEAREHAILWLLSEKHRLGLSSPEKPGDAPKPPNRYQVAQNIQERLSGREKG